MAMKRFRVAGHSMLPALQPGQEIVAVDTRLPASGNLVVFEQPDRAGHWLVKRMVDDSGWVASDNEGDASHDSRTLGPIPIDELWPVVTRLDPSTFTEAARMLVSEDAHLAAAVDRWGMPEFWQRRPGFPTLVLLILEQQVSLESGAAMYRRLRDHIGEVGPEPLLDAGPESLRSIGVTRQKTEYLLELSRLILTGALDLADLGSAPVDTAREALLRIKGIGPWTADAYLLSAERRPDMWPVGDRALQVGTGDLLGLATTPDVDRLEIIGAPWRPVRAVAARLIWHTYLSERGRVEPPDPTAPHE